MNQIDMQAGVLNVNGTTGDDIIHGNNLNNTIVGNGGNDQIWGGSGGEDIMVGSDGAVGFWWGHNDGNDAVINSNSGNRSALICYDATNAEHSGSFSANGDLTVRLSGSNNTLTLSNWSNMNIGQRMQNFVFNEGGNYVDYIWNAGQSTQVYLTDPEFSMIGVRKAICVDSGSTVIRGSSGADYIQGGSGDDHLWGGSGGNDTLAGGGGADTFWWGGAADGNDVIEYGAGNTQSNVRLYGLSRQNVSAVQSGSDYVLTSGGSTLTIKNWSGAKLEKLQFDDGLYTADSLLGSSSPHHLNITFDYSLDSSGFFTANPYAKACLQKAADEWTSHIIEDFPTVAAGTVSRLRNPVTENYSDIVFSAPVDDIVIYVGAHNLTDATASASLATPYSSNTVLWDRYNDSDKAQPWAGSITFDSSPSWADDSSASWWFDPTPSTDNDLDTSKYDFVTVAAHEIGHILGITRGLNAFSTNCSYDGKYFYGSNAYAANNYRYVPLIDGTHPNGYTGNFPTKVVMSYGDSYNTDNNRSMVSAIDLGMLKDCGYNIV